MQTFNLTPSPFLLDLLGKIPFKGSQCVAELIDNSIDAIINNNDSLEDFQRVITVSIPTKLKILANEPLIVEDWGVGMTETQLENAVKAGFSSKNTSANLGLFGMGFNVATSRLANTVEVWTSTWDMDEEIGVRIDLREMKKSGSFIRPRMTRSKRPDKKSGTRIEIFDYKPEAQNLLKPQEIKRELEKSYSEKIFSVYGIRIFVNQSEIRPFKFCTWNSNRFVKYKYEEIPAIIDINERLKEEMFCENCFSWLGSPVATSLSIECPYCNTTDKIVKKEITITGWVGIQRYSDPDHYGIDISRNGRILSRLDKSLFSWDDDRAKDDFRFHPEYPRDTTYAGGRIVGQIEANFLIPKYTKDDFERDDKNWRSVVDFLRGEMPLQPDLSADFNFRQPNRSPIGLLFNGYRKINTPGSKTLVFAREKGNVDHVTPKNWATKFYDGDLAYQDDTLWWEEVIKADLKDASSTINPLNPLNNNGNGSKGSSPNGTPSPVEKYPGKKMLKKTLRFDIEKLIGEKPYDITLIDYMPNTDTSIPIIFEPQSMNRFNVYLNNSHPMFRDFADGYEDLVYMEVASKYAQLKNSEEWTLTRIYYELKSRYAPETMLSVSNLVTKANNLVRSIQNSLVMESGVQLTKAPALTETEEKVLIKKYLELEGMQLTDVKTFVKTPQYLKYLDLNYVFKFIGEFPNLIFDGKIFNLPYAELDEENKHHQLKKYLGYFDDVHWFMNDLAKAGDEAIKKLKSQIIRNRFSLQILYDSISK
jgi:hypothetical protein